MALNFVRGDTLPQIQLTLTNEITNTAIDLTGATVNFNWRSTAAAANDTTGTTRQANITAPTTGVCTLVWAEGDLNIPAGNYEAEVEIVYSNGARETVYELLSFTVREDIA